MSVAYSGPYSPSRWGYWSGDDDDLASGEEALECGPASSEALLAPVAGVMAPSGPLSLGRDQRHLLVVSVHTFTLAVYHLSSMTLALECSTIEMIF